MFQRKNNLGAHRFKYQGRWVVVRSGETVDVPEEVFGESARSGYVSLDPLPDVGPNQDVFLVAPASAPGWYNVLKDGQPVNEAKLRKNAAEELKKELEG